MPLLVHITMTDKKVPEKKTWEMPLFDPKTLGFSTSAEDEKSQVFHSLVVFCSTLQARFAPYVPQSLELTLLTLRSHPSDNIRNECIELVPKLLSCSKESNTLTAQIISVTFLHLIGTIGSETEPSSLMPLLKCFTKSLKVVGGPTALSQELHNGIIETIKHQLDATADKRRNRSEKPDSERIDQFAFTTMNFGEIDEDMENFALEDIERLLRYLDPKHPLLATVASVRGMGRRAPGVSMAALDDMFEQLKQGLFPRLADPPGFYTN